MFEKIIIIAGLFLGLTADAALSNLDKSLVTQDNNMLLNPGFESGRAAWENVGAAGTYTVTSTAANVYQGGAAGSWDSSASAQVFRSGLITSAGRSGSNGVASCVFKSASGTATHTMAVHDNSGNVLSSTSINATSSAYQRVSVNFPFGSITSARIVIASVASNEPELFIDSCFMGSAQDFNLSQISQASFYGSVTYAATTNCTWPNTNTTYADFPADTDCPTATVAGFASAPATKIPGVTFASLPPGEYLVMVSIQTSAVGGPTEIGYRWHDGTTAASHHTQGFASSSYGTQVVGRFSYTTAQSNLTFRLQGYRTGGTSVQIGAEVNPFQVHVYRFPSSAETAVRADALPASWSGYHDNTCSWSRTNTAYGDPAADATCALVEQTNANFGTVTSYLSGADRLPGIVFTPSRAGRYLVLADFQTSGSSAGVALGFRLETSAGTLITEGSHLQSASSGNFETKYSLKGIVNPTSAAPLTLRIQCKAASGNCQIVPAGAISAISWSVIALDQSFPSPLLMGSVTSNSSGLERVERATVSEGAICSGSPCTITRQSGSWLSSVTRSGTGAYVFNFAAGIFSGPPACSTQQTNAFVCRSSGTAPTSTTYGLDCRTSGGTADDFRDLSIICMGPR